MATENAPISKLPPASTLLGSEPIPTVQGDETRTPSTVTTLYAEKTTVYTTPAEIAAYVNNNTTNVIPPAGTITMYAGSKAPTGWLICDGSLLQNSEKYGKLYAVIGTTFTGNESGAGANKFRIPDMQGKVAVGTGSGRSVGAVGGAEEVTLKLTQIPPHRHAFLGGSVTINDGPGNDGGFKNDNNGTHYKYTDIQFANINGTTQLAKAATAHNNMPPYIVLNYIIKY